MQLSQDGSNAQGAREMTRASARETRGAAGAAGAAVTKQQQWGAAEIRAAMAAETAGETQAQEQELLHEGARKH